jgi:phenylacetate-CoA ligase
VHQTNAGGDELMSFLNRMFIHMVDPKEYRDLKDTLGRQYMDSKSIQRFQNEKWQKLSEFLARNNDYYRKAGIAGIRELSDLQTLPFLTKEQIRRHADDLKSKELPEERFIKNSTSGSTGDTLVFYSDAASPSAYTLRGDSWTGWQLGDAKVILWGADRDAKMNVKRRIKHSRLFYNTKILSSYEMTDKDMHEYVGIIRKFRPKLLIAYPSSLTLFAEYILNNDLKIPRLKGIVTGGETLYEFQREIIEKAFECKVLNRYGGREVHHIAGECPEQDGLHISSDHVVVEIVDEHGKPCKPGELGEVVVTDLDNYVFPFIRYKTGDLAVMAEPDKICACGRAFPKLERVEGRTFDLIIGSNGNRIPGNFFTLLRTKIKGLKQIQVLQKELGAMSIVLSVDKDFTENEKAKMIDMIKNKAGEDTTIDIEIVDYIPSTKSGKHRWVISEISPFVEGK